MRIGIDIRVVAGPRTGIGRYASQLLRSLAAVDNENEYVLFYNAAKGPLPSDLPTKKNMKIVSANIPNKALNILWAYTPYPKVESFVGPIDVFHAPNFQMPPLKNAGGVLTIHDLVFLVHPEMAIPSAVRHLKPRIREYAKRADLVVADSKATAQVIVNRLGVAHEKVVTIYVGATVLRKSPPNEISRAKTKYSIGGDYILFVGSLEPRKNLARLFKAFVHSNLFKDFDLVLAGPRGWHMEEMVRAWKSSGCKDRIRFLDYVTDIDLGPLYSGATFLAYPSLAEGFGLPILEAMSVGCPVLTSSVSSMPEVAGDAARFVDPMSVESIAQGMTDLISDSGLRARLIESGYRRLPLFTWENTAIEMMKAYRKAFEINAAKRSR
jgi:glycosyltransferase involved in cell wall biosynthesis